MKNIALVTPWPPQTSGIADYAYELASHLMGSNVEVHIFTNELAPQPLNGVFFHHVYSGYRICEEVAEFDAILLQLGNHPYFHGYMLQILERLKYKCIVELHDLMLHHLVQGDGGLSDGGGVYFSWLKSNYGESVGSIFQEFFLAGGDILKFPQILEFPCSDVIVQNSYKIIVHSDFVKSSLARRGCENIHTIDLATNVAGNDQVMGNLTNGQCFRIGVFGGVQRNRRVEWVVQALSGLLSMDVPKWQLDVVGHVDDDCQYLLKMIDDFGMSARVKFHGRLPISEFNSMMSSVDLHIALRSPTMGETSAVVIRAMKLGVPSIVSNVGWYSELPPCVLKIDDADASKQLTTYILMLIKNSKIVNQIRSETTDFAKERLNLKSTADDILNIVFE